MIHSQIGEQGQASGRNVIALKRGDVGFALYGPYVWLSPGRYVVGFDVSADISTSPANLGVTLDVVGRYGKDAIIQKRLTADDTKLAWCKVDLEFDVKTESIFEFRVFSEGLIDLTIGAEPSLMFISRSCERLPIGATTSNQSRALYQEQNATFALLEAQGASIQVRNTYIDFTLQNVRLHIINAEDVQILTEVFLLNTYSVFSPRDSIVIDIGMNVGTTSLFLASKPAVREVHAFEPFSTPYTRAQRNFDLNPEHARKIRAHQIGLGDSNGSLEVLVRPDSTIGGSLRGDTSGSPETIQVREAAIVIAPLADQARRDGLDVFVKMDCEGSEFAIIENLESAKLLGSINTIAIEWHKWWSASKTQDDLIRPLLKAGFVVIDQTHLHNPHAGMLYAVRTG